MLGASPVSSLLEGSGGLTSGQDFHLWQLRRTWVVTGTLPVRRAALYPQTEVIGMERVVHKTRSHEEAARWDVEQQVSMTPQQRLAAARVLKDRVFPPDARDVRACHRPA
jgi:hypothetical protein